MYLLRRESVVVCVCVVQSNLDMANFVPTLLWREDVAFSCPSLSQRHLPLF